ncbi:uncharacterized protein LOC124427519 [Vespa crabro]|uniref:uncharacterized protein LOC124427519 n=1 Tax=Vespa crabro TaxID=7445 RepID=UPI001EFFE891|nr:uncharacterized protein LOC124427519 [Vespa crabro]
MERWAGKIAIVTGASSGMGLAIAKALVQNDVVVIGFARRKEKMQSEMQNVKGKGKGKFYACECDVTKSESIEHAFEWVKNNFGTVHILVNNAGISSDAKFMDSSRPDWKKLFDVNVLGLIDCSKRAARMMLDSNVECYIVNMNSVLGHNVDLPGFTLNFYPSSKFASVAATEIIQKELYGSKIRVTSISPGLVSTNIMQANNFNIKESYKSLYALEPNDVANAIIYVIGTPQRVHITELIIRPFGEVKYAMYYITSSFISFLITNQTLNSSFLLPALRVTNYTVNILKTKMERWAGKVAIVTGASSGIGLAIAKAFVQNGILAIGFARRKEKMESEMKNVKGKGKGKFYACECDVTKPESIEQAFEWVKNNFGTVHILVNNAGVVSNVKFMDSSRPDWQRLFDVNVLGLIDCTKRAARIMLDSNVEGYIINMNSIAGHYLDVFPGCSLNFYPASKFASVAATDITQKELYGSKIRVTSISPGLVSTEIFDANNVNILKDLPALEADDIANAVIYVIGTPQRVHITELIIRPFGEVKY